MLTPKDCNVEPNRGIYTFSPVPVPCTFHRDLGWPRDRHPRAVSHSESSSNPCTAMKGPASANHFPLSKRLEKAAKHTVPSTIIGTPGKNE
ncbi:hypothetical protein SKAU_G00216960 [Synaphobranchus kaupii]|uniref:Uncharacterized protein n=1 Tax=Synaphobranchus kaupii TaxID=118154 RepID=A0A9Q1F9W6_SYNKA|nr:hypothetical protein SKAU_G00216960 [Synaphobranchus kaupii]